MLTARSSTMQHATPVAGPSSPPESRPPYHCPFQLAYPPNTVPNPHYNSLDPKPSFPNIPSSTLYRPQYLPEELDERIDKRSIWIGVDKETGPLECDRSRLIMLMHSYAPVFRPRLM